MPTTPTGLLRRRASLIYRDINVDGRTIRALVVATPDCIERCCDDGVGCAEVIRLDPCRSTTGPPDNPCSMTLTPVWACADSYCRHSPFEIPETFAEMAQRNASVVVLVGNACYYTVPSSRKRRSDLTDAERPLLILGREWECVPGGCTDPICTEDYEPCACLCYAVLSTDGQDSYFCCYGLRGQNGLPPTWATQVECEMTAHITVEQIAGGSPSFGPCDVGANPVADHLAYRYRAVGATDGTAATGGGFFGEPECCVGGWVTVTEERYPLPMPVGCPEHQATPNWPFPFPYAPGTTSRHIFCPGHGWLAPRDETQDQGGDDLCRNTTRRVYTQVRNDCDAWEYTLFFESVNCTSGYRHDGSFGPIARVIERHRMHYRQIWQRPFVADCAACGAAIMAVRGSTLSRAAVEAYGYGARQRPADPAVMAFLARQMGGCRGCGD